MEGQQYTLFYTILHKGLKHPQIWVFMGVLEPIPCGDWGTTEVFEESKVIHGFDYQAVDTPPSLHRLRVDSISEQKSWSFVFCWKMEEFKLLQSRELGKCAPFCRKDQNDQVPVSNPGSGTLKGFSLLPLRKHILYQGWFLVASNRSWLWVTTKHSRSGFDCLFGDIGKLTEVLASGNLPGKTSKITLQTWSDEEITTATTTQ